MLHPFIGRNPRIDETNYVAPSADIIGDVSLGQYASVWFNATVRGDVHRIRIGERSNIQDNAVVHVTNRVAPTTVGDEVTVGHSAVIHGCTIENRVLVGMGAVVMDNARVGSDTIIGARALITAGVEIPERSLVLGTPAEAVRSLTDAEVKSIRGYAANYVKYSAVYRGEHQPDENPFYD